MVPDVKDIFRPLIETPLEKVKICIIGQEPPSMMDTDGLAFSYPKSLSGMNIAPIVLENIFQEYIHDLKMGEPTTGNLLPWAKQGVLLWNETPTCIRAAPSSHYGIGWRNLTLEILETLYLHKPDTVFMFWTPNKDKWIEALPRDANVVDTGIPQLGFSHTGFFGSSPFTKANTILALSNKRPVNWALP